MRPEEIDIAKKLAEFDETDESFLSQNKDFYEKLINLKPEERVFDGEYGNSK